MLQLPAVFLLRSANELPLESNGDITPSEQASGRAGECS